MGSTPARVHRGTVARHETGHGVGIADPASGRESVSGLRLGDPRRRQVRPGSGCRHSGTSPSLASSSTRMSRLASYAGLAPYRKLAPVPLRASITRWCPLVSSRSRSVPPARTPRAPSDKGRKPVAPAAPPRPRKCGRSAAPNGRPPPAGASTGRCSPQTAQPHRCLLLPLKGLSRPLSRSGPFGVGGRDCGG